MANSLGRSGDAMPVEEYLHVVKRRWRPATVQKSETSAMKLLIGRFAKDKSGVTAIEYSLIAAFASVSIVAGAFAIGTTLSATFATLAAAAG
jgi:pilus assembly protein Flp/PilA